MVSYNLELEQIESITKLHEIYIYFKYFYYQICNDIRPSLENLYNKEPLFFEKVILELINRTELSHILGYIETLNSVYNIYFTSKIQFLILNSKKWYKIIKYEILHLLGKIDVLSLITKKNKLNSFNCEYFGFYKRYYDINNKLTLNKYKDIYTDNLFRIISIFKNNNVHQNNNVYYNKIKNQCLNCNLTNTQIEKIIENLKIELNEP